jgi:hypothetical protein
MRLPENPHMERKAILHLQLVHNPDVTLPVHERFSVVAVQRRGRQGFPPRSSLGKSLDAGFPAAHARGKLEFGDNFYGVVHMGFFVAFNSGTFVEKSNQFSIDKSTARAKIVRQDWWILLREYIELGAKVKFCYGRFEVPWMDDACCCGGWVHDAEKLVSTLGTAIDL